MWPDALSVLGLLVRCWDNPLVRICVFVRDGANDGIDSGPRALLPLGSPIASAVIIIQEVVSRLKNCYKR